MTRAPAGPATARPPLRPRLAAELLRAGHAVDVPLGGASMRPLLPPGTSIRIEPVRARDVGPGDVVVLDVADRIVCHRVVYKTGDHIVTRGDDAPAADPPLPLDAVVGRVRVPPSPRALYAAVRALLRP